MYAIQLHKAKECGLVKRIPIFITTQQLKKFMGKILDVPISEDKIMPVNTFIKKSSIPNSGNGLFADQDIPRGTIFGKGLYKFANDGVKNGITHIEKEYLHIDLIEDKVNTRHIVGPDTILLQAIKDIKGGDEITRYYGSEYWLNIIIMDNMIDDIEMLEIFRQKLLSEYIIARKNLDEYLQGELRRLEDQAYAINCHHELFTRLLNR